MLFDKLLLLSGTLEIHPEALDPTVFRGSFPRFIVGFDFLAPPAKCAGKRIVGFAPVSTQNEFAGDLR